MARLRFEISLGRQNVMINKLFIIWLCFCRLAIGSQALQENNALELANQSTCYVAHKHKPYK